jgi:N-acetyl-gamma-glutamyl-phosphate reductase
MPASTRHGTSVKIFIDGEAGTTGLGIHAWLQAYPDIEILSLPPEQRKDPSAKKALMSEAAIVVLCLPDEARRFEIVRTN